MTTGTLTITERNLDVAMVGEGFFVMARHDGSTAYTRDGNLQVAHDVVRCLADQGVYVR